MKGREGIRIIISQENNIIICEKKIIKQDPNDVQEEKGKNSK
jgi:hypothetical protein